MKRFLLRTLLNNYKLYFSLLFFLLISFFLYTTSYAASFEVGDGRDGDVTISTIKNINSTSLGASTDVNGIYADGYALKVSANPSTTDIYVGASNPENMFFEGDKVLLINLRSHTVSDYGDVGNYEILTVISTGGTNPYFIKVSTSPVKSYDGTSFSNQIVAIQRVPQYKTLTINSGGSITTSGFDGLGSASSGNGGYSTGVVALMVKGELTLNSGGKIDVSFLGYRGSSTESFCGLNGGGAGGIGIHYVAPNNYGRAGGAGYCGGGGGSSWPCSLYGGGRAVGGAGGLGGAGGGGGTGSSYLYGGGGAGYGSIGFGGYKAANGGTNLSGNGGGECGGGGGGGGTYGVANLTKLYHGSAGGPGGNGSISPARGGNGGGIIYIMSGSITISGSGTMTSNGGNGNTISSKGGGGGASGGSILINGNTISLATSKVTANGGSAGNPIQYYSGGAGGVGRIALYSPTSAAITGSSSPNYTYVQADDVTVYGHQVIAETVPEIAAVYVNINGVDKDITTNTIDGIQNVILENKNTTNVIAEITFNFSKDISLSSVNIGGDYNKAFFHSNVSISSLTDGTSSSFILYVPKGDGDKVWICPGASNIEGVKLSCAGGYFLSEGQTFNGATASVIIKDTITYWKIEGLTGTGGMSVVTGLKDTLSRLQVSSPSDHTITFGTNNGITANGHSLVLEFDPSTKAFDLSSLTISDIKLTDNVGNDRTLASSAATDTWGVSIDIINDTITFTAPTSGTGYYPAASQILIKIGTNAGGANQILNPSSIGSFKEYITITNADTEGGLVDIPIIDSDRVDITGYVTAYIHFDIDTATGEIPGTDSVIDCNYNVCLTHQNGDPGLNYTVDLGELTSAVVNKSNTTSVAHTSGGNGIINSIYFDISTNAPGGAVVEVTSANGGLQGPGTNKIPSIGVSVGADGVTRADGEDIPANSGVYGYNLPVVSSQLHGSIIPNSLCDSLIEFCGPDSTPKTVFTTNNLPVDTARVRMDLAAAASYTNNPGLYTDTLTFIATATF